MAPLSAVTKVKSQNWGGYVATGPTGSVTMVNGSWVVPAVTCPSTGNAVVYEGIGIDSYSDDGPYNGVGTYAECSSGTASYHSWFTDESAGGAGCGVCGATVSPKPGDVVTAEVVFADGDIILSLTDPNSPTQYSASEPVVTSSPQQTADWVVFQFSFAAATFANFGKWNTGSDHTKVTDTDYAVISGHVGTIKSFTSVSGITISQVSFVDSSNRVMASPSALSKDGTSFTITWKAGS